MITAAAFLSGIAMATFAMSGIFFLKFWKASRDSFFLLFSVTCWLLALERVIIVVWSYVLKIMTPEDETGSWVYLIRLAAFVILTIAVVQKNRASKKV